MPRVLYLKGLWAFCMRADVSHCFHSASTETDMATGVADTATGTAVSLTSLIRERVVKRLWNVGNAPATPQPLYLLGFQQIRERWNLFFENQFF